MGLFREPLLHFLSIGAVIDLLYGAFSEPVADQTIVVSAAEIQWMQSAWRLMPYSIVGIAAYWIIDRVMSYMPPSVIGA